MVGLKWVAVSVGAALGVSAAAPAAAQGWERRCEIASAYSDSRNGVAILVLHDGKPVCEHYTHNDPETAHELWSGTKSFVGIMVAAAVQDGILSLDEPVADTLSEWQADPVRRTITIRHLLTMSSGQPSAIGRPPTYADSLRIELAATPGARFQYGPTPMQIFGEVMRRKLVARGENGDPVAYLRRRVLDPIGLTVAEWRKGPDGNPLLAQGAVLASSEWAKLGEFVRGGGQARGRQILDRATLAALFQPSQVNPAYGLTWWLPHKSPLSDPVTASTDIGRRASELPADLVAAAGAGDQRLYVIPSKGLTIVRQARLDIAAAMRREPSGWSDTEFLLILLR